MATRRQQLPEEEDASKTPAWIVSFADMITLLLAFFVLLQVFAEERDPELFRRGQGAFRREVAGLGIPNLLFGRERGIGDFMKKRNPTKESEDQNNRDRVIDPIEAQIRKAFEDIKRLVEIKTSNIESEIINVTLTPIRFAPNSASLDDSARSYLSDLAEDMGRKSKRMRTKIRVVGLAADAAAGRGRWTLSARRAQAVSEFLDKALSDLTDQQWMLVSVGAGAGDAKDSEAGSGRQREHIRIVVTESE